MLQYNNAVLYQELEVHEAYRLLCPVHAWFPADGVVTELHLEGFNPIPATAEKLAHSIRYQQQTLV